MKKQWMIAFMILASSIIRGQDTTHIIKAPHDGVLESTKNYKIEAVESYGCISIYLYDNAMKPISNTGISGEILFYYSHDASLNVPLIPKSDNSLLAEVLNSSYYYYIVNLNIYKNKFKIKFNNIAGYADTELKNIEKK